MQPLGCSQSAAVQRPWQAQLSAFLPEAAELFPPSATEARKEFQPHPGILFAWSSISGQAAGIHKQFAASNLTAVEGERVSLSIGRKRNLSVFNIFYQKPGSLKVFLMKAIFARLWS